MSHIWVNTNQFVTVTYDGDSSFLRIKMTDGSEWFKAMTWEEANDFVTVCSSFQFVELKHFIIQK